ncbi:hypothetical protein [Motilimonas pumila]|nr:hypothetical protein [Motilimonas pumila]
MPIHKRLWFNAIKAGLCILGLSPAPLSAEPADIISKDIVFVSTAWMKGEGTFRIIRYSSEYDPCFVLQHYQFGLNQGLTGSSRVCSAVLSNNEVLNVSQDLAGGSWFDRFDWQIPFLTFQLDTAKGQYGCKLNLTQLSNATAKCAAQ